MEPARTPHRLIRIIAVAAISLFVLGAGVFASAQEKKSEKKADDNWRLLKTGVDNEFTSAEIFSLATTLFVDNKGNIYDTWDTSLTMTKYHLEVINSQRQPIDSVRFTCIEYNTDSTGFICGEQGILLQTDNWGRNWTQRYFENLDRLYFYGIDFATKDNGVLVGVTATDSTRYEGIAYRTTNGGDDWTPINNIQGIGFSRVRVNPSNRLYVIVGLGNFFISKDLGATWQAVKAPGSDPFRDVDFEGEKIIAVGMKGAMYTSNDNGANWEKLKAPASANFVSVYRYQPNWWYVCGDGANAWETKDAGATWTNLNPSRQDCHFRGIFRMGPRLFVWGTGGTILVKYMQ